MSITHFFFALLLTHSVLTIAHCKEAHSSFLQEEKDSYEKQRTEKLNDLLVKAFELIRESDAECNSYLFAADDWVEEEFDNDCEDVAQDLFTYDKGRTDFIFMEMVKLDTKELKFIVSDNRKFLQCIYSEMREWYSDYTADRYHELLAVKPSVLAQGVSLNTYYTEESSAHYHGKSEDGNVAYDYYDEDEDEENETRDYVYEFCNGVADAIEMISDVNHTVNRLIENDLEKQLEDHWDDDYDDAAEDCIFADEDLADWMLIELAELDIDDASFLSSDSEDFIIDFHDSLQEWYKDNVADYYKDSFIQKKTKYSYDEEQEDEDEDSDDDRGKGEYMLQVIEKIIKRIIKGDETVNEACDSAEEYVSSYYGSKDYDDAAMDMWNYNETRTEEVYGWLARQDTLEIAFLTKASRKFLTDMQTGLDETLSEAPADQSSLESLDADASIENFLVYLLYALDRLYYGDSEGNAVASQCETYVEDTWDGDEADAAEESYDEETELSRSVFSLFLRLDLDELEILQKDQYDFLDQYFSELKDIFEEEEGDAYELVQTKSDAKNGGVVADRLQSLLVLNKKKAEMSKLRSNSKQKTVMSNLLQTKESSKSETEEDDESTSNASQDKVEELQKDLIAAIKRVEVAESSSNELLEDLHEYIKEHWKSYEAAAEDLIDNDYDTAADIYLALDTLDVDECFFLIQSNMDVLNDIYDGMMKVYAEIADEYDEDKP